MIKTPLSTVIGGAFWTPKATILGGTSKTFDQLIKSLFANSEQGFFYDPNDLSTLFQDSAGTIPVTGAGQPVGLVLDKSKGFALEHILSNSNDFTLSSDKWNKGSNVQFSLNPASGAARLTFNGTHTNAINHFGYGPIRANLRERFEVSFDAVHISGGDLLVTNGYSSNKVVSAANNNGVNQRYSFTLTNDAWSLNRAIIFSGNANTEAVWEISNVSTACVQGNHAMQYTSAARPILRQNATTGAYYLEFDGSDDFLQTGNIDFTATDKVSLFAGVRKLSDSTNGILLELSASITTNSGVFCVFAPRFTGGAGNFGLISKGTVITEVSSPAILAPVSAVISVKSSILASVLSMRVNGALSASSNNSQGTGNFGNYPLFIGRRGGTSLPFNGHIYNLIGVGRLTTEGEIAAIEKELAKRTGVTLSV